jgi:autotransporter-associated beta strand protein
LPLNEGGTVDTISTKTIGTNLPADTESFGGVLKNGTGPLALTKTGEGTQILTGANTYTGATTIAGGVLGVGHANALGTGSIGFSGGVLRYEGIATDFSARFSAAAAGQAVRIDTNGQDVAFATGLSGSGGLEKGGAGKLALNAASAFAGPTQITGGTLSLDGDAFNTTSGIFIIPGATDATIQFNATQANNRPITVSGSGTGAAIIEATNLPSVSMLVRSCCQQDLEIRQRNRPAGRSFGALCLLARAAGQFGQL